MERKYTEVIKISKEDKDYLRKLKEKYPKMSLAGINSYIIKTHRENSK